MRSNSMQWYDDDGTCHRIKQSSLKYILNVVCWCWQYGNDNVNIFMIHTCSNFVKQYSICYHYNGFPDKNFSCHTYFFYQTFFTVFHSTPSNFSAWWMIWWKDENTFMWMKHMQKNLHPTQTIYWKDTRQL